MAPSQPSAEKTLRDKLFKAPTYDKTARPVIDHSKPVNVTFGLRLSKLIELVGKHNELSLNTLSNKYYIRGRNSKFQKILSLLILVYYLC